MHILQQNDIMACGTIRCNRKHMPKNFPADKDMKRGDISYFMSGSISVVKWMENRGVYLSSNFIDPIAVIKVERRVAGQASKIYINCPAPREISITYVLKTIPFCVNNESTPYVFKLNTVLYLWHLY